MSGVVAFEGDLNAIVKEYLEFNTLQHTADIFEKECVEKDKPIEPGNSKHEGDTKLLAVQNEILRLFDSGQREQFLELWKEHVPEKIRSSDSVAQKLAFYLHIYFAIYSLKHKMKDADKGMNCFKMYLEKEGAALSQTSEFLPFYALPFVTHPKTHPSFKDLFSDKWVPDLRIRLEKFLVLALQSTPQPRLFELYKGGRGKDTATLEQRALELERKAQAYHKQYRRLQTDYHKVIGITADLVDHMEETVRGNPVPPQVLENVCAKLFSVQVRETMDFTRPGTAGAVLRQSVVPPQGMPRHRQTTPGRGYDYDKIKHELTRGPDRSKALLLQALRWKLTRSAPQERDAFMSSYISHDLLGCRNAGQYRANVLALLAPPSTELVRQHAARLFNAFASLVDGRTYLASNEDLLRGLMDNLPAEQHDSITRENVLGCLQKLSLRRQMQSQMIEEGIIEWLVTVLADNDALSDYTLEYSVALFMNVCLRTSGKKRCAKNAPNILKMLSDLLGHDNQDCLPYVNGTLYSILAIPSIREDAKAMGMQEILACFINPEQLEMNRQIEFIIKQLNSVEEPEDVQSDDEEEEEEEGEEQDALEQDLDKQDSLKPAAASGELSGDRLLNTLYVTTSSPQSSRHRHRGPTDGAMAQEDVLRRPVTPSHFKGAGDVGVVYVQPKPSRPPTGQQRPDSSHSTSSRDQRHRPPTRSGSRGNSSGADRPRTTTIDTDAHGSEQVSMPRTSSSRRSSSRRAADQATTPSQKTIEKLTDSGIAVKKDEYAKAFGTNARIPRTPEVRPTSRGSASSVLRPEYSDSLPTARPNSGSGRPSSSGGGGSKQTSPSPRTPRTPKSRTPNHR